MGSGLCPDAEAGIVPSDQGGHIPVRYNDYVDIFSKDRAATDALHWAIDHVIDLQQGFNSECGKISNDSQWKLNTSNVFIAMNLANVTIQ